MQHEFDRFAAYGGRKEYQEHGEDELEECLVITDIVDDLLRQTNFNSEHTAGAARSDKTGVTISRSFRFLEADRPQGWAWPLNEKRVDLEYHRSTAPSAAESYTLTIGTVIHRLDIADNFVANTYVIDYLGEDRHTVDATIEEPDILNQTEHPSTIRTMVGYDRGVLFDDLLKIHEFQYAQHSENQHIQSD